MKLASQVNQIVSKILAWPWLPDILAGFAALLYFYQSVGFAFTQWSVIDEGNYIYKGWLFVTGQYIPYQDFGPWTNHTPLSFLIFGYVQLLFGPGLRTIRYFMVFVGCLLMLGMWLAARRLAGRWAAMLCLWFLALNPFPISDYSVGIAEGLVACTLAWTLYFILGEGRSIRELLAGSVLAAVLVLIRENMILILPFLFLYVFWQHGRKAGLMFLGVATSLLLAVLALYWPGIVGVWAKWLPKGVRALFGSLIYQGKTAADQTVRASFLKNLFVVLSSIRANFFAVVGPLTVWLSWPKGGFQNRAQHKTVVFLSVVFVGLYAAHAWASLGKDYCSFCLVNYLAFFSPAGILLFFAFLPGIEDRQPLLPAWVVGGLILLLITGLGYANYLNFGDALATIHIPKTGANFSLGPGRVILWQVLANKFHVSYPFLRSLLPTIAGLVTGLFLLGAGFVLAKIGKRDRVISNPIYALIIVTMLTGLMVAPTVALGGIPEDARCEKDTIAQYEKVGAELAQRVPAGARVYWRGTPSPALLLYLPGIKIYPPQLNGGFSFRAHADPSQDLRFGFWDRSLDRKWRKEADILLIRSVELSAMNVTFSPKVFVELEKTSPVFLCTPDDSQIRIFKRK